MTFNRKNCDPQGIREGPKGHNSNVQSEIGNKFRIPHKI